MATRNNEVKLIPALRNTDALNELKFGDGSVMSLTDLFGKRFEGSVITREFDLINRPVQTFVRRDFIYLSRCFYMGGILGENPNVDAARVDSLEKQLFEVFSAVQTLVRTRLNEVRKLLQLHGVDQDDVHTARPMSYLVPIIHPRAYQYLDLLRDVDELHSKREHAWLLTHIDHKQRNENFREIMKAVRRIGFVTRMNRIAMWKMLQRAAEETGGTEGAELMQLATEQSQTLVAERKLNPESAGTISTEAALPSEALGEGNALPAEAGTAPAGDAKEALVAA
jgi:hypothetical protein